MEEFFFILREGYRINVKIISVFVTMFKQIKLIPGYGSYGIIFISDHKYFSNHNTAGKYTVDGRLIYNVVASCRWRMLCAGVCHPAHPVGEPRFRGSLRAHQDVHHQDVLRQGLGSWVPQTGTVVLKAGVYIAVHKAYPSPLKMIFFPFWDANLYSSVTRFVFIFSSCAFILSFWLQFSLILQLSSLFF